MSQPPCPVCGKAASVEVRPFCSKRCADVDLHRWLSGGYAIPAMPDDELLARLLALNLARSG